jgi:hypothetical protein
MDKVTFISSLHTFDYNGREYDLLIKANGSVRLIDVLSHRILLVTDIDSVYTTDLPAGMEEARFVVHAVEVILKNK